MFASEMVEVRVDKNNVTFRSGVHPQWATIDRLRIDYDGVCLEFPDLKGEPEWKALAIERFKDKIACFKTEREKVNYIMDDLKKHGYIPKYIQRAGHRPERIA